MEILKRIFTSMDFNNVFITFRFNLFYCTISCFVILFVLLLCLILNVLVTTSFLYMLMAWQLSARKTTRSRTS